MTSQRSLIRQATERLEQLERAGVHVPWALTGGKGAALREAAAPTAEHAATQPPELEGKVPHATPEVTPRAGPSSAARLDFDRLRRAGLLTPDVGRSVLAQQFRRIKRPLLKNARGPVQVEGHPSALIMVTSALADEGKTHCAVNLAMSMALEVDTAVLLVDADVVRPSVLKRLGIESTRPGLLDLLTQPQLRIHEALIATNVPKLSVMPAGDFNERSTELLASAAMDRLLAQLVVDYADHLVVFDAPPLLPTTESSILASKVGQVVMVVEARRTPRHAVQQAFAALHACPLVLSVLNKTVGLQNDGYYGYGEQ